MTIAALFTIAGALSYGLSGSTRLQELGRITFFVGAFWLCHELSNGRIHF